MEKYLFPVKKNDRIVVHATAGGVGLIATQLAHHLGAHVIGIVFSDEKAALACANGADHVVVISFNDYVPLEEAVSTLTSGKGVHAVYDSVGQATFESNLRIVRCQGPLSHTGSRVAPSLPWMPSVWHPHTFVRR